MLTIREYVDRHARSPFREWLDGVDQTARARIQARLLRVELGNLGDHKLRLDFGPGFRLYFGRDGQTIVLLLIGGTKATQARDIRRARDYWREYLEDE
jgi:putative addiction module killer protein